MSKEYIERERALEILRDSGNAYGTFSVERSIYLTAKQKVKNIPTIDVAPVRHGRWEPEEREDRVSPTMTHKYTWYYCSECGRRLIGYSNPSDAPYCHCGAKMGGDHIGDVNKT